MSKEVFSLDIQPLCHFLAAQDDVVVAYLFGSVAQGQAHSGSDVDLALLLTAHLDEHKRANRYLHLIVKIQHLLSDYDVDVILLNTAPPLLQHEVLLHGKRLYEGNRSARVEFEVRAGQQYEDVKPMHEFFDQALFEELETGGLGGRRRRYS
jgi:hypothetical protein